MHTHILYIYIYQAERCSDPFGADAAPAPPRVPRGVPPHGTHNAHVPPEARSSHRFPREKKGTTTDL